MFMGISLLIAIRFFHAPSTWKAFLVSLCWIGGIFSPWVVQWASRCKLSATQMGGCLFLGTGLCFFAAACMRSFPVSRIRLSLASVFYRSEGPIVITMYVHNYPSARRATYFSIAMTFSALQCALFSQLSGFLLDIDLNYYTYLLAFVALCSFFGAICLFFISSPRMERPKEMDGHYLHYLWKDRKFALLTFYFFLTGVAYQMLIPMRIEYLANVRYGMNLSNLSVLFLSLLIPNAARIITAPLLGKLFDHLPMISMRILVSLFILCGYWIFFHGTNVFLIALGSMLLGMAMAGSFILHSFWISRIVDEEKVPAYMAVYALVAGVRSILAPMFGYLILSVSSPTAVANVGLVFVLIAIIGFWCMRHDPTIR
jgi:MFS family permease